MTFRTVPSKTEVKVHTSPNVQVIVINMRENTASLTYATAKSSRLKAVGIDLRACAPAYIAPDTDQTFRLVSKERRDKTMIVVSLLHVARVKDLALFVYTKAVACHLQKHSAKSCSMRVHSSWCCNTWTYHIQLKMWYWSATVLAAVHNKAVHNPVSTLSHFSASPSKPEPS